MTQSAKKPRKITLIAAISRENAIGVANQLPWHLPSDLAFFKAQTLGRPIVMGRKTWDSIGRVLPGRVNVVISRQPRQALALPEGVELFASIEEALTALATHEEIMIIGGAEIFAKTIGIADQLILNRIDTSIPEADTYFPEIDQQSWQCINQEIIPADGQNSFAQTREFWTHK